MSCCARTQAEGKDKTNNTSQPAQRLWFNAATVILSARPAQVSNSDA
jgi:hypothetical protein